MPSLDPTPGPEESEECGRRCHCRETVQQKCSKHQAACRTAATHPRKLRLADDGTVFRTKQSNNESRLSRPGGLAATKLTSPGLPAILNYEPGPPSILNYERVPGRPPPPGIKTLEILEVLEIANPPIFYFKCFKCFKTLETKNRGISISSALKHLKYLK